MVNKTKRTIQARIVVSADLFRSFTCVSISHYSLIVCVVTFTTVFFVYFTTFLKVLPFWRIT